MHQLTLDHALSHVLRDDGIGRAVDHADAVIPKWSEHAFAALRILGPKLRVFTAADIRRRAHDEGLPLPPDARAWGAVFVRARRLELIRFIRFVPDPDPKSHCCPTKEYRWGNARRKPAKPAPPQADVLNDALARAA